MRSFVYNCVGDNRFVIIIQLTVKYFGCIVYMYYFIWSDIDIRISICRIIRIVSIIITYTNMSLIVYV